MGSVRGSVHRNSYRDSVELMSIAAELERLPGIRRAGLVMATPANLAVLADAGLADAATDGPGPNDLVVAVLADDQGQADEALARAGDLLASGAGRGGSEGPEEEARPETLREGLAADPGATLALISTPGTYASAEALRALKHGLDVFLFSDNVPIEDEIRLKRLALERGRIVMGPDCGTAIVGGIPLGFANAVRRGSIGIAAASGTGLQQVSCLVHRYGAGVSHAIGTGGRDLDERVGGITMLAAIDRLLADPGTDVLVLISKPPSASVATTILERVRGAPKPVVVNFLGADPDSISAVGATPADTFEDAARAATELTGVVPFAHDGIDGQTLVGASGSFNVAVPGRGPNIRGLYSGGSLAGEARLLIRRALGGQRSDRIIDLGDDEYTVGRPHPMIDPRLRVEQIGEAGRDRSVGVLLLDIVLGYGSHPDPAGALVPAIRSAVADAAAEGRSLSVVASVCGTDEDPQGFDRQEELLREAGVIVAPSNAQASLIAARLVTVDPGSTQPEAAPAMAAALEGGIA